MSVMFGKVLAAVLAATLLVSHAQAARWMPVGGGLFVDKSSKRVSGTIAQIDLRAGDLIRTVEVDCNNRIVMQLPAMTTAPHTPLGVVVSYTCARWYEFWK